MFVLVHSPLVGPLTWGPVAERLDAVVPSLVDLEPPYWRSVADKVAAAITEPAILVAHSNAGLFVPVIAHKAPVTGCLIVDGRLPGHSARVHGFYGPWWPVTVFCRRGPNGGATQS